MPSVRDYFDTDMRGVPSVQEERRALNPAGNLGLEAIARVHLDFDAHVKYVSFFLSKAEEPLEACEALIVHPEWALDIPDAFRYQPRMSVEPQPHSRELPFSNRVFIYAERRFSDAEITRLQECARKAGIIIGVRDRGYAERRAEEERALAFISHDSDDADEIARPLAVELGMRKVPVWFSEYSLRPGTSLRESIEQGMKECRKCVLILSRRFMENRRWAKAEFDGVFAREVLQEADCFLPVWVDVTAEEVYKYCPRLADRVALPWSLGVQEVARQLSVEILTTPVFSSSYRRFEPVTEAVDFGSSPSKKNHATEPEERKFEVDT